jgi:peptide-methionine (S)-S-oxide reductase
MWERNTAVRYFITTRSRKKTAEDYIGLMTAEDTFGKRIVTKISPVSKFYEAEKVHQLL